jgi:hypothetical protein
MRRNIQVPVSVATLVRMRPGQRDEVFRSSPAGEIPRGTGEGVALLPLGPVPTRLAAVLIRTLIWKGKVFEPRDHGLRNRMTPFGFKLIRAKVSKGPSWVDGQECIVLDYSRTSLVAHWIRDEIRQVAGRIYLGQVFVRGRKLLHFTLTFPPQDLPRGTP